MTKYRTLIFTVIIVGFVMYEIDKYIAKQPSGELVTLEGELISLKNKAKGTPAEFMGNRVSAAYMQLARSVVMNKQYNDYEKKKNLMFTLRDDIKKGINFKFPPKVNIPYANVIPNIDGVIEQEEWNDALTFFGEYPVDTEKISDNRSIWKIKWNQKRLYWCSSFYDDTLICSENNKQIYNGDSLELFVRADRRLKEYREIVIDISGREYAAWNVTNLHGRYDNYRDGINSLISKVQSQNGVFSVEASIPWSEIPGYLPGCEAIYGSDLIFMFVRVNRKNKQTRVLSTPVPFLYDGHNIYGHINGTLVDNNR